MLNPEHQHMVQERELKIHITSFSSAVSEPSSCASSEPYIGRQGNRKERWFKEETKEKEEKFLAMVYQRLANNVHHEMSKM